MLRWIDIVKLCTEFLAVMDLLLCTVSNSSYDLNGLLHPKLSEIGMEGAMVTMSHSDFKCPNAKFPVVYFPLAYTSNGSTLV